MDAALLLARLPPIHLLAEMRKNVYYRTLDLKRNNLYTVENLRNVKSDEEAILFNTWREHLRERDVNRNRTVHLIEPIFERWINRLHGRMTFRLTQMLTGHGCFSEFLMRIGKIEKSRCLSCQENEEDDIDHTLRWCSRWEEERTGLRIAIGEDLTLSNIVMKMLDSEENWQAMSHFSERAIIRKEEEERAREENLSNLQSPPQATGSHT